MPLDDAPYLPFMDARAARPPGLAPLDMRDWTVRHADFDAQMAYRRRLLAERPEAVLGLLPEGEDAAAELLEALLAHLGQPRPLTAAERASPLAAIGRLTVEDFCLLTEDAASGEYRLVAAVLCFPSRWLLSEKLGRPMTPIHHPVPGYAGDLARRVNRVMAALHRDRPLVRVNWSVHPTAELFLPASATAQAPDHAPSGRFYLRTERQTLIRLPRTGAIAFGIKTSVTPLERLSPPVLSGLVAALAGLDPETVAYKGGRAHIDAAIRFASEIACADGVGDAHPEKLATGG